MSYANISILHALSHFIFLTCQWHNAETKNFEDWPGLLSGEVELKLGLYEYK